MLKNHNFAIKNIAVLFIVLSVFCVLSFAYINNRISFYDSNPEYINNIVMSYDICDYNSYDCWGSGGHIIFINIDLISEKPVISVSNSDPEHHTVKEHKLNRFETYLLCDMANYMLHLTEHKDEKYTQKFAMYWNIYAYDDTQPYLLGQIISKCRDSFKVNLFLLISMTIFYKYIILALVVLYSIVLFCIYKCIRNTNRQNNIAKASGLRDMFKIPQAKFILLNLLSLFIYGLIYIPIYKEQINYKMQTEPFVPFEVMGVDIRIGMIYALISFIMLCCVLKKDRINLCVSYILSTSAVLWYQYVYFKEKYLYIGNLNIVPAKSIKFDILLLSEAIPFYPQLFYFTLLFVISLVIHYIMITIIHKDKRSSKFLWVVTFAVNNSVLTTMTGYVLQYILKII